MTTFTFSNEHTSGNGGTFSIAMHERFKPASIRKVIIAVLNEELTSKQYDEHQAKTWADAVSSAITQKLIETGLESYKFLVHVVIGEQRGAGIKVGSKCFWDPDTDGCATFTFTSNWLYCVATVFGIYYY